MTIKSEIIKPNLIIDNNGNSDEVCDSMTDVGNPTEEKFENEKFNYVINSCIVCNTQVTHITNSH